MCSVLRVPYQTGYLVRSEQQLIAAWTRRLNTTVQIRNLKSQIVKSQIPSSRAPAA